VRRRAGARRSVRLDSPAAVLHRGAHAADRARGHLSAIEGARRGRTEALIVLPDPITSLGRTTLVKLADEYRIPTMYSSAGLVAIGGLLAYGPSVYDSYRRAAVYVDKILKGAKPADLPGRTR